MLNEHKNNIFNRWEIAYRVGGDGDFSIVSPPDFGWTADPFLVDYRGDIYLFAEVFLWKSERNGVICYCKYNDGIFGEWTVSMDKHWHLSYPYVFSEDEHLYMVPESYQMGEVVLYELKAFPDVWEKKRSILSNVEYCDSTFLRYKNNKTYMFTFERGAKSPYGRSYLFEITADGVENKRFISDNIEGARCGGKIIVDEGRYFRVAQNCVGEYGRGLIFYEIDEIEPEYKEHELYRLEANDIKGKFQNVHTGIHTYNRIGDIEVVDLKYSVESEEEKQASDRVRKVFVNKYL